MSTKLTEKSRVFINPFWSGNGAAYGPGTAFILLPDKDGEPDLLDAEDVLNWDGEVLLSGSLRPKEWIPIVEALLATAEGNFSIVEVDRFCTEKKVRERDAATWLADTRRVFEESAQNLRRPGGYIHQEECPEDCTQ